VISKALDERSGRIAMTVRADANKAAAVRSRFANSERRAASGE
jgi:hypothetical protein